MHKLNNEMYKLSVRSRIISVKISDNIMKTCRHILFLDDGKEIPLIKAQFIFCM